MPTQRSRAHRYARNTVAMTDLRRLSLEISRISNTPSPSWGQYFTERVTTLTKLLTTPTINELSVPKPRLFNPIDLPRHSCLMPLDKERFRIPAEIKSGLVIHWDLEDPRRIGQLQEWRVVKPNRSQPKVIPFEKQICNEVSRNVYKIPLSSLGDTDIEAIRECLQYTYSDNSAQDTLFIEFHHWYWDGESVCLIFNGTLDDYESLAEFIQKHGLQAKTNARAITIQILKGLTTIHKRAGIYNYDLDPENIYISSTSPHRVKLSTLPLQKLPYQKPSSAPDPGLRSRQREQNIWSLGCIVYRLLTSDWPLNDSSSRIWKYRDIESFNVMSVDYRAHSNKHPSKHKLESCASSFAAEFVKNLLTIGYIPTAEAAQKHTWIAKPVNGKKLLRVDVKHPSLQHTAENCWVVVSLVPMGDDRYQLFLPNDVPRNTTVNQFLVKRVPLSTYYAREKEYEKEINMLNNLHSSFAPFQGWFENSGNIYFLMEYSNYGYLSQYLKVNEGTQNSNINSTYVSGVKMAVCEIARQILEGLVHWNAMGYSYLRPENIMISSIFPMRIKLLISATWDIQYTATHMYMAPELLGLQPTAIEPEVPQTDSANMWSLGCLVYMILTGEYLSFDNSSEPQSQYQETVSTEYLKMLKQYCDGSIKLPIPIRLENSPAHMEWLPFLKAVLLPSPASRLASKAALESPLFQTTRVTSPYRWGAVLEDNIHIYLRGAERTRWRETKRLNGGCMGTLSVMETTTMRGVQRMVVKALIKYGVEDHNGYYRRELITLIKLKDDTDLFVKFLGWYEDSRTMYIAMEYMPDGDLAMYLADDSRGARRDAREITTQLLEGLEFLHENEMCHRDLKPQNVLVACRSPVSVKLADFGLSKSTHGTRLRSRVGTPHYQAPELFGLFQSAKRSPEPVGFTHALDIWSLGCLVHTILVLEPPFLIAGDSTLDMSGCDFSGGSEKYLDFIIFGEFCRGEIDFPRGCLEVAKISDNAIDFIEKLLVPDPNGRVTASEALNHRWLNAYRDTPHAAMGKGKCTKAIDIRDQLCSIGIDISRRTADNLVQALDAPSTPRCKKYLPSRILRNIDVLRDMAFQAGHTLLHNTLCRVNVTRTSDTDALTGLEWTLGPDNS